MNFSFQNQNIMTGSPENIQATLLKWRSYSYVLINYVICEQLKRTLCPHPNVKIKFESLFLIGLFRGGSNDDHRSDYCLMISYERKGVGRS